MSISAIVAVADMQAVNDALEAQGFGPGNFSVPAFTGPGVSHAALHAWDDPVFLAALQAIPEVTLDFEVTDPVIGTNQVIVDAGAQWGMMAPLLEGVTVAGKLYKDTDGTMWSCIQSYDTAIWPDPYIIPALIRRARDPNKIEPWQQPIDQFDSYLLPNAFTGVGDKCSHVGKNWITLINNNVWQPGAVGSETLWAEIIQ
jgi:hypothetical protein